MTTIQKLESRLTRSRLRQGMAVAVFALAFFQFLSEGRPVSGSPSQGDAVKPSSASAPTPVAPPAPAPPSAVVPVVPESEPPELDEVEVEVENSDDESDVTIHLGRAVRLHSTGDRVVVGEGEDRPRAQFLAGGDVDVNGNVSDVFALGGQTTIRGVVRDNAFLLGGEVALDQGTVNGDLHACGGDIRIDGEVHGDAYLFGGEIVVARGTTIHGDLTVGGGETTIEGTVLGSIQGGGGHVTIDGPVGGGVDLHVGELTLGPAANIKGDLSYQSPAEAAMAVGAAVAGATQHELPPLDADSGDDDEDDDDGDGFGLAGTIFLFTTSLLFGFAVLAIGGAAVLRPSRAILDAPAPALGWGFAAMVLVPVLSALTFLPIVTAPVGIMGFIVWFVGLYVARLVTALAIGIFLFERLWPTRAVSRYGAFTLGLVIHYLVTSLPLVGKLELFLLMVVGLGGIVLAVRARRGRPASPPPAVPAVA